MDILVTTTEFLTNNTDTIVTILDYAWDVIRNTVIGASIITAFTKTRDSKFYKLFEVCALVFNKAKDKA